MRRRGEIDSRAETALAGALKRIHFAERSMDAIAAAVASVLGAAADTFVERFAREHRDVKASDA